MDALMYPRSAKASQIVGGSGRRNRLAANTFRNQAISQINGNGGVQPGLPATWQFLGTASSYPTFLIPPVTATKSVQKTKTTDTKPSTATCRYLESTLVVKRKPSHSRSIVATPNTATPSRCRPAVTLSPFLRSPPWLVPAHVQRRTSRLQKRQRDKAPAERSCKSGTRRPCAPQKTASILRTASRVVTR